MTLTLEALMYPGDLPDVLAQLLARPAWMRDAACREHPTVSFFPERGEALEPAKAVCAACLVRSECLAYALEHGERGIWGGTSEQERQRQRGGRFRAS